MIPLALLLLIRMTCYSRIRRHFLNLKRPRHAVYSVLGVLAILMVLAAPWFVWLQNSEIQEWAAKTRIDPAIVSTVMFLLAVRGLIFTSNESTFHFSPGEIDFLFPGPFSRRQVLAYRIVSDLFGSVVIALLVSGWLFPFTTNYVRVFLGVLLGIIFIEYLPMAATIIRMTVVEGAYSLAKKVVLLAAFFLLAVAILRTVYTQGVGSLVEKFHLFRETWAGTCLLAPFEVFSRFVTAHTLWEAAFWGTLSVLVNLALFAVILWLDANYLETALTRNQSTYEQFKSTPGVSAKNSRRKWVPWRPKAPPYWAGAGAIIWRQSIVTLRRTRREHWGMLVLLIVFGVFMGVFASSHVGLGPFAKASREVVLAIEVFLLFNVGMFCLGVNPFDFRIEIKQMDSLKTLPCTPIIIVLGELATPTFMVACWMLLITICSIASNYRHAAVFVAAPAIAFPLTLLFLICENIAALYFPMPQREGPPTLRDIIHAMLMILLRWFFYFLMAAFFLGIGTLCYFLAGRSWLAFIIALWIVIAPIAYCLIHILAIVYDRFDPSRDIPQD